MPNRHGLMRWEEGSPDSVHAKHPCFLVGIEQFFNPNLPNLRPPDTRLMQTLGMHFRGALSLTSAPSEGGFSGWLRGASRLRPRAPWLS
jgi:hypothetical protein